MRVGRLEQLRLYTDWKQVPGLWLPTRLFQMQQSQLHTEPQQASGRGAPLKLTQSMCTLKAQPIRWQQAQVLWLQVPAVHAAHSLGSSLLLSGGATLTLSLPGTCVMRLVSIVGKTSRIKGCVLYSSLLTSATRPRMSFRSLMRSPAQGTWQP